MLKHIYSIPSIKVMSVDTEDILTTWSGAHEGTGENGGSLTGDPIGMKDDNSLSSGGEGDDESQGAKGITFDFE